MQKTGTIKMLWQVLKQSVSDFFEDKVLKLSAALAYYTIFSVAPMLIIIIFLCDLFLGKEAVEGSIYGQISGLVGDAAALQIQAMIKNATLSNDMTWATAVGFITLIIGATGVFAEIQDSINYIWRLKSKPKKNSLLRMLLNRLLSFSLVVSMGFILLVSLAINGLVELFKVLLTKMIPEKVTSTLLFYVADFVVPFIVIATLFAIIFKVLPDARIKWKDVRVGAFATAILFMIGKFAIGYYLGASKVSSTYGAAGSIVIILLWVYYSAAILYFGAVFTRVYVQHFGKQIYPNDYAVWIKQVEVPHEAEERVEEG
ncbi:YihY/virulence factor BrkB family protein [Chitinophaga nivalis]|uniref:YihY/virulence factor BrkB family protein n=1 Tax=Chitinophaga nivalis TaxID=2991709 RepID=A0ABT3IU94_9BACT|nr:YihY/virulence factor BrkB family protein [Chitinophaga nivalis]MCW3462763.1 YihY/virulence factor BrkB family protein [Chitinophaga nivalis]MCW3487547.1 YihY/virulence factor BrkB family protein [Chitinophaga nivalis]